MKSKNDSIKAVIFFVAFAAALILWLILFNDNNRLYLNNPYLPDEGRSQCIIGPSGDCL